MIVKTCRGKAIFWGVVLIALAAGLAFRMTIGLTTGLNLLLEPLGALFLAGGGLYLFGIAWGRPVAMRMDADGISGYFAAPICWEDVAEVAVFKEKTEGFDLFPIIHVGIRLRSLRGVFDHLGHGAYTRALRRQRKSGYHFLIPQMLMKDMDAAGVVALARAGQQQAASAPQAA